jgi:hypothetical protein
MILESCTALDKKIFSLISIYAMKSEVLKKLLFIFLLMFIGHSALAQRISYNHKVLMMEGCTNVFTVVKQQEKFYIVVTVNSYRLNFLNPPTFKVKTTDGEVLEFVGNVINESKKTSGAVYNGIGGVETYNISTAQFEVTPEQFEKLSVGIKKIQLSTVPYVHEKNFKKDKLGKKLHKAYVKAVNDDF